MTRMAILGCGHIALSMAATLRAMKQQGRPVELYACAARDADRAEAFARREGFSRSYGSYAELLADPAVELVYIATPHSHHAEQIRLCVDAGKAVLCEKAFTANAAQAEEVLRLAEEKGVLVTEAIWTRYMPYRRMLSELIAEGAIGQTRLLTANLCYAIRDKERIRQPELAGGALLDVGVYCLNFASMVLGDDIVRTDSCCTLSDTGMDMTDSVTLQYRTGETAQLLASAECLSDRQGAVYGTRGFLKVDNINNPSRIELWSRGSHPDRIWDVPRQLTGYEYEVEACLRALHSGDTECAEMFHADTLTMMRQMDALRRSWGVRYPFEG